MGDTPGRQRRKREDGDAQTEKETKGEQAVTVLDCTHRNTIREFLADAIGLGPALVERMLLHK